MLVFLSFASVDRPVARRLRDSLEAEGIRVWLDEAEVRVGQSIPVEVERGIDAADALCLLISAGSKGSLWVDRETNAYVARMLTSGGVVLPCRLDETAPPPLLADIKYADFRSSFESGLAALLTAIGVKEEIDAHREIEKAVEEVVDVLNRDEVAWFVWYFGRHWYFMVGDRREQRPPRVLDHLAAIGLLDRDVDRYELLWTLNDRGRRVRELLQKQVPAEAIERVAEWWREVGRERGFWSEHD